MGNLDAGDREFFPCVPFPQVNASSHQKKTQCGCDDIKSESTAYDVQRKLQD